MGASDSAEMPRTLFFFKSKPKVLARACSRRVAGFFLPVGFRWRRGSGGGGVVHGAVHGAVHGGQEVSEAGPLGWANVLAHVHYAVHCHLGVFLDQAAGDRREGLEVTAATSSVGLRVALRIPVQGHVTLLGRQPEFSNLFLLWSPWEAGQNMAWGSECLEE